MRLASRRRQLRMNDKSKATCQTPPPPRSNHGQNIRAAYTRWGFSDRNSCIGMSDAWVSSLM